MHCDKPANVAHSPQSACSSLSYDDCRRSRCSSWGGYSHTGKRGALHEQPAARPVVYLSTTERAPVCVARVCVVQCAKSFVFVGHIPEVFGAEISFAACVGNIEASISEARTNPLFPFLNTLAGLFTSNRAWQNIDSNAVVLM